MPTSGAPVQQATHNAIRATPATRAIVMPEPTGTGMTIARVAGVALIALCVACWTGAPLVGMLTYSALATLYLLYLGVRAEWVGPLLWPAVVLHAILTFLLAWRGA